MGMKGRKEGRKEKERSEKREGRKVRREWRMIEFDCLIHISLD